MLIAPVLFGGVETQINLKTKIDGFKGFRGAGSTGPISMATVALLCSGNTGGTTADERDDERKNKSGKNVTIHGVLLGRWERCCY